MLEEEEEDKVIHRYENIVFVNFGIKWETHPSWRYNDYKDYTDELKEELF